MTQTSYTAPTERQILAEYWTDWNGEFTYPAVREALYNDCAGEFTISPDAFEEFVTAISDGLLCIADAKEVTSTFTGRLCEDCWHGVERS